MRVLRWLFRKHVHEWPPYLAWNSSTYHLPCRGCGECRCTYDGEEE